MDWSFPKHIAIALLILGVVGGYPLYAWAPDELIITVLVSGVVMTANVLLGYVAIEYSFQKSTTTFFKVVLGGMGLRMALLTGVLLLCITRFGFHPGYLIGSMGVFYVVFLTMEVVFIQSKVSRKQQQ